MFYPLDILRPKTKNQSTFVGVNKNQTVFYTLQIRGRHGLWTPRAEIASTARPKLNPNPNFLGTAEAYFVCHIGPIFQISLIYAFIGCLQSMGGDKKTIFRLFPIISISQNFFSIFFLTLEKIGIDEKVICYHNISN